MADARIHRALADIPADDWDALHDGRNPFVAHAFLDGMERTGVIDPRLGWTPWHLGLWDGGRLVAAAPCYLKGNSHGEFVFDHAWAHAFARAGVEYFPKWLGAVPYSPVTGPRLLAADPQARVALVRAIEDLCETGGLSSGHVNFHTDDESGAFGEGWHHRLDLQYHWRNADGWASFEEFLGALGNRARKNIRQERAKVERAGIRFRVVHGDEASREDLSAMHGFYLQTFAEYGNHPALTPAFLRHLAREAPRSLVMILAEHAGEPVAGALCLRGSDALYGRYWGSSVDLPGLHFETCYYQGIEYCLRHGLVRFEPGAQGEHKLARGYRPVTTHSAHHIAHPGLRHAVADYLDRERREVEMIGDYLEERAPFRKA